MKVSSGHGVVLTATMPSAQAARRAIEALQFDGIDAAHIALHRPDGRDASLNVAPADKPILWRVFWTGLFWSIVGGIVGAGIGYALAVLDVGLPGTGGSMAIQVASWAMFMHVAGALWGCYAAISSGEAWALTFSAGDAGPLSLDVRTTDDRLSARAEKTLRERGATSVIRAEIAP